MIPAQHQSPFDRHLMALVVTGCLYFLAHVVVAVVRWVA